MSSKIEKHLPELVNANLITADQAQNILTYFKEKKSRSNTLITIYAILGSLLVSLGIILIIAHNWDNFSKTAKTIFAFIPLLVAQVGCAYSIIKNKNAVWRESFATFLFFAVAASISMVAQIYHISGDFTRFLLTWSLLTFPIAWLMRSSMASLLYIALATLYGYNAGYSNYDSDISYRHWLLLAAALPFTLKLKSNSSQENFFTWHLWFLSVSLIFLLGTFGNNLEEYIFMSYVCLFSIYLLISHSPFLKERKIISQPFYLLGMAGTFSLLLTTSFDWFWKDLHRKQDLNFSLYNTEVVVYLVLALVSLFILINTLRKINYREFNPVSYTFIVFSICFFAGMKFPEASILIINVWVFYLGVRFIFKGSEQNNLITLNFGLIVITGLILCRYFDSSISFLVRGLGFLLIGAGFFIANLRILQKRKKLNSQEIK